MSEFHQPTLENKDAPRPQAKTLVLRTDGPTLAEYVAQGYPANTYPPYGYAAKAEPAPGSIGNAEILPATEHVVEVDNTDKTDELSLAAKAALSHQVATVAEPVELPPGKYCLDYVYNGTKCHETHRDIPHALARIAALKRIGIVAATSTTS